ncbi:PAS domain S-box protein [Ferruginibacter lapsinanis]|uniref:sensor histidine kinase n=1 Tax=Ferruginibacter lapsinanis TaxID=563172 RepID=UPI001E64DD1B|nr:PAS domain S-box protein [Ferruginibacter lapsinanis]UEG48861.1 PAS domain S-box protein [Ferruginibacter lapsinanis]
MTTEIIKAASIFSADNKNYKNTDALVLLDANGKIFSCNKTAVRLLRDLFYFNYQTDDNFLNIIPKKGFEILTSNFYSATKGITTSDEYNIVDKRGKIRSFIFTFTPTIQANKKIKLIAFSLIDITQEQHLHTGSHNSQKLIDLVFHTSDIGIAIVNSRGRFAKVNDGLNRMLGYKQNELIGKPYLKIIVPEERKQSEFLHKQYLSGKEKNIERKIICKKGNLIDCSINNSLFIDDDGNKFLVKIFRDISENKKYKDLLQEAEKMGQMGGYELDVLTNKLMWTDEMYRIFDVKNDFIPEVGKVMHMFTEESRKLVQKKLKDALNYGKDFDIEVELMTIKKNRKWVRITCNVKRTQSKITTLTGIVQDNTFGKESDLKIEQLSWVASHTNNAVIITDSYGKVIWVNKSFEELTGYKLEEIKGKIPGRVLQGKLTNLDAVKKISRQLKLKQASKGIVLLNYTKEGKPIWITSDIAPIFKDGNLINFVGIMTDITELIEAKEIQKSQQTLKRSLNFLETIAKDFPKGIIGVLDKELKYVFIGGSELKKFGHPASYYIGNKIFYNTSPEAANYAAPFLEKVFQGESCSFDVKLNEQIYSVNAVPLRIEEDTAIQILVVIQNITDRKKSEEEILRTLEKQRELNNLKTKFVSIASHEFRTPLSGILSSSYLISKYNSLRDDEKVQKHIDRITESVNILTDILNDFLSLGKIEEGKIQNTFSEFCLKEFCNSLINEIQPIIKKGQTIVYKHRGELSLINSDKHNLRHIIINLLSNAVKYSSEGKKIWITTTVNNGQMQFTIKDEGIGIPKEDQEHLFQTFFRANNAATIQGTGMGLHIAKKYLDILGGRIQFSSTLNKGTKFSFQLPVTEQNNY